MEDVNALAFATELSKKFREACDTLRANGLDPTKDGVTLSYGAMLALCDSIDQLERERDAAVEQLRKGGRACSTCKFSEDIPENDKICEECRLTGTKLLYSNWEWGGPQEVE